MPYAFELAKKYGKMVEVADAGILEIYEKKREAFAKSYKRFALALIDLPALLITLAIAIYSVNLLLVGFPLSPSLLFKALFLAKKALSNPLLHVPIVVSGVLAAILWCRRTFMDEANNIRDSKVVERVCELVAKGYNVLVVRGEQHVKFIAQELQKRGVPYEIVH
jgi:intracellular sulfur oxidation DsrE/DsrF family protein